MEAEPEFNPIEVSTEAAIASSCSSSSSPVLLAVPPVRITSPVIDASPIFSAGSYNEPVRILTETLTSGSS